MAKLGRSIKVGMDMTSGCNRDQGSRLGVLFRYRQGLRALAETDSQLNS
jgi:hypothetical protein